MKQTAVKWLVDQVEDFMGLIPKDIIEQAKEMEKEQIVSAAIYDPFLGNHPLDEGIKYYNQTYGK